MVLERDVVSALRTGGCVFAEDEARLLLAAARGPAHLASMMAARIEGRPLEHVIGWAEFSGLRIVVADGVFVPRRRTEFLVAQAVERSPAGAFVAVDLCCGAGALGLALAVARPEVTLHCSDIEPDAVSCAVRNLGDRGRVHEGDLFASLPAVLRGGVDILLANVPYVPTSQISLLPTEAREHEPRVALDGGPDGLAVLRRVVAEAPDWLSPRGLLFSEISVRQADVARDVVRSAGLVAEVVGDDDLGATVVIGRMP